MAKFNLLTATAEQLQRQLSNGTLTSVELVKACVHQIATYNPKLRAVIQLSPEDKLIAQAAVLDNERREQGSVRGPLHGIPVLIKDNIATHPSSGLGTTAGSLALLHSKPRADATIVHQLQNAGAIILGKTNLSEWAFYMGKGNPCGWSAVGGQTQSAYVHTLFHRSEAFGSHSNCGGSSSGSAVAVSAGFAPVSIGTETCGSLLMPANRAGLYTMKPSIGLISQHGIVPASDLYDSAGPMTKSAADLANVLEVLVDAKQRTHIPTQGYASYLNAGWKGLKFGFLNPSVWRNNDSITGPDDDFAPEMELAINAAYNEVEKQGGKTVRDVELISLDKLVTADGETMNDVVKGNFDRLLSEYLSETDSVAVHNLRDVMQFNKAYQFLELDSGINQEYFADSLIAWDAERTKSVSESLRNIARAEGVDLTLARYDIDVILGPAEPNGLENLTSLTGYPTMTLPLATYSKNGRPFGMAALAGQYCEAKLIQLAGAWEQLFPRPVPEKLDNQNV